VSIGIGESGLTEVELAVDLLTVDDVELVRHASVHVAELKVEPLVVVVRIHIAVYYQVILVLTHLDRFSTHNAATGPAATATAAAAVTTGWC